MPFAPGAAGPPLTDPPARRPITLAVLATRITCHLELNKPMAFGEPGGSKNHMGPPFTPDEARTGEDAPETPHSTRSFGYDWPMDVFEKYPRAQQRRRIVKSTEADNFIDSQVHWYFS